MPLRERSILNSEMGDARAIFNSTVETSLLELERLGMSRVFRNEKVTAISTLASGQDLLSVLKRYPTFTSCQHAACSNMFFSQLIKQAVPEIHEEGDEIRIGSFNR